MNQLKEALLGLYRIDTELVSLKRQMDAGPEEIRMQEEKVAAAREARKQVEAVIKEKAAAVDNSNLDIRAAEAEVEEQEQKLRAIKNNKEYKIVTERIKELKQKVTEQENLALLAMEEMEALRQDLKAKQDEVAAAETRLEEIRREVEAENAQSMNRVRELKGQRNVQVKQMDELDPEIHGLYSQALRRGEGDALAKLQDGVCQKCFRKQSPNIASIVKVGRQLKKCICAGCGRLLYVDDGGLAQEKE